MRLALALVTSAGLTGCSDDDDDDGNSGGARDAGATDSGARDASTSDAGGGDAGSAAVVCGGQTCTPHSTALGVSAAGCATNAQGAEVCGISSQSILMGAEPKFLEKDAPGVASTSCAQFYDARESADGGVDGGTTGSGNGLIDTVLMTSGLSIHLRYPGCCTAAGFCSGNTAQGEADLGSGTFMPSNAGYGCLESTVFFSTAPEAARRIPCNPTTGAITLPGGGAGDGGVDGGADGGVDGGADGG